MQSIRGVESSKTSFTSIRRAELVSATPVVPDKAEVKDTSVKIATSNLFIENEPEISIDEMTKILFDTISSKEIVGYAQNDNVSSGFQVAGFTENISNIVEVANNFSSKNILPIKTRAAAIVEDIANYDSSTSYEGVITITSSSANTRSTSQIVLQILEPETFLQFGKWEA